MVPSGDGFGYSRMVFFFPIALLAVEELEKLFCTDKTSWVLTGLVIAVKLNVDKIITVQNNFICIYILGLVK
jgi:hypothetical protein